MARHNSFSSRRLGLEALEGRQLMAANPFGDVTAYVSGGDLVLTGDSLQNDLQIVQTMQNGAPIAGSYYVAPRNGTTLNGQAAGHYFEGVTHDMRINLGGGNDRLILGNGSSDDNFIVPNDLSIDMGGGADVVTVDRISVRDDATILTGDGNDSVSFKGSVGADKNVDNGANDLTIDTGARPDNVLVQDTFVRRNLSINTGNDNYSDVVDIYFTSIGNNTAITTGDGGDIVDIADSSFAKTLTIKTGSGNDSVSLNRSHADELLADLGAGTDVLKLKDTSGRIAKLNGGTEADALLRTNSPFSEAFFTSSF